MDNPEVSATKNAISTLESGDHLLDLKLVAQQMVTTRLQNTLSAEQIRAKALAKLKGRLDDDTAVAKITVGGLLNIIDTLNDSTKEDVNTIIKASMDKDPKTPGAGDVPAAKNFGMIEKLVEAAESVVDAKKGE